MKITLSLMKKLGYQKYHFSRERDVFIRDNTNYPFNHMEFYYNKKKHVVALYTNGTYYDCSTLEKLLSSVFFAGIDHGRKQKLNEIKKLLEIRG